MHRTKFAQAGLILVAVGVGFAFAWWYPIRASFFDRVLAYELSALAFAVLMVIPSAALTAAGLVLYVSGRRTFWTSAQRWTRLLALLGLALMVVGGFLGVWFWAFAAYAAGGLLPSYDTPLVHYLAENSPYFSLFALWVLSGLLIFADAIEATLASGKSPAST